MLIWITVALTTLCTAIEVVAEVVLKKFAGPVATPWAVRRGRLGLLILGALMYFAIGLVYGYTLTFGSVTISNSIWQCSSLLLVTAVGVAVFRDRPTILQWSGIGAVLVGSILLVAGDGRTPEWSPLAPGYRGPRKPRAPRQR